MDNGRMIGLGLGFLVLTGLLVALLYQGGQPEPVEPAVIPPAPEPLDAAVPRPAQPAPITEPKQVAVPEPEPEPDDGEEPAPQPVDEEVRRGFNYAVDDAIKEARDVCIDAWVAEERGGLPATFVMDAVARDGEVAEVVIRGLEDTPKDVIDCARDAAWNAEWPTFEHAGELRFQRTFTAAPPPPE